MAKNTRSETDLAALLEDLGDSMPDLDELRRQSDATMAKIMEESKNWKMPEFAMPDLDQMLAAHDEQLQELLRNADAPTEPLPPPDPNLTPLDVADWMKETVEMRGRLDHHVATYHILRHFGSRFTRLNGHGSTVIHTDVLEAFRGLTEKTVVWEHGEKVWRLRRSYDPPSRRVE